MKESSLDKSIKRYLERRGYLYVKLTAPPKGIADRLCVSPRGHVFLIETKYGENELSAHQKLMRSIFEEHKIQTLVPYTLDEVKSYLETFDPA